MPARIFSRSFTQAILDSSRKIRSLSDLHCHSLLGSEPPVKPQLQLPAVPAPSQYLIEMGFQPTFAQHLSKTYMDFVARYRKACQSHFDSATHGGGHITEYYREVFIILFKRTTQAWSSQIVSIARVRLCQAGALQATVRPERVDIRVDDSAKVEIISRLGLRATHLTSDSMATSPRSDVTSRLEEVSEQTHALSTDRVDSCLMLSELSPISWTEVISRSLDPFSQPAPPTCFPAPYPPPPGHSSSYSPERALATTFIPPAPSRNVRPSASYTPDVSSLTNLFSRMTVTTLKTDSINPKCHRMFGISESNKVKPVPSPIAANFFTKPQLASMESIASPPKSTITARRRKIATLPTRRSKTSGYPSPLVFDSAGATFYSIPHASERVVEKTLPDRVPTSPRKAHHVSTLPSLYTAEAVYVATSKPFTTRQRKVHTLHHKALPQSQTTQNQTFTPPATAGKTSSYTGPRSPPLVSDATSYFDSPPTSSDELDTPPSTPPCLHVLLARSSTEGLAISSESDRIVFHEEPLGNTKVPNPRQRYRRLNFTKGGLGRDEQPLTFTFSV